jgi:hypothetical protein
MRFQETNFSIQPLWSRYSEIKFLIVNEKSDEERQKKAELMSSQKWIQETIISSESIEEIRERDARENVGPILALIFEKQRHLEVNGMRSGN